MLLSQISTLYDAIMCVRFAYQVHTRLPGVGAAPNTARNVVEGIPVPGTHATVEVYRIVSEAPRLRKSTLLLSQKLAWEAKQLVTLDEQSRALR